MSKGIHTAKFYKAQVLKADEEDSDWNSDAEEGWMDLRSEEVIPESDPPSGSDIEEDDDDEPEVSRSYKTPPGLVSRSYETPPGLVSRSYETPPGPVSRSYEMPAEIAHVTVQTLPREIHSPKCRKKLIPDENGEEEKENIPEVSCKVTSQRKNIVLPGLERLHSEDLPLGLLKNNVVVTSCDASAIRKKLNHSGALENNDSITCLGTLSDSYRSETIMKIDDGPQSGSSLASTRNKLPVDGVQGNVGETSVSAKNVYDNMQLEDDIPLGALKSDVILNSSGAPTKELDQPAVLKTGNKISYVPNKKTPKTSTKSKDLKKSDKKKEESKKLYTSKSNSSNKDSHEREEKFNSSSEDEMPLGDLKKNSTLTSRDAHRNDLDQSVVLKTSNKISSVSNKKETAKTKSKNHKKGNKKKKGSKKLHTSKSRKGHTLKANSSNKDSTEPSGVEEYNSSSEEEMPLRDLKNNLTLTSRDAQRNGLDLDQSVVLKTSNKISSVSNKKETAKTKSKNHKKGNKKKKGSKKLHTSKSRKGHTLRANSSNKDSTEPSGVEEYNSSSEDEMPLGYLKMDLTLTSCDAHRNGLDLNQSAVLDGGEKEISRALPVNKNPSMKSSQKGDTVRLKSHEPEISNKHKCGNLSEASGVEMYNSSPQAEMSLGDLPNNFTSTSNDAAKNGLDLDQSAVLDGGKNEISRARPVNKNPSMKSSQKGDTVRLKSPEPEISNKHKCGNPSEVQGVEVYNSSPQDEILIEDPQNDFTSTSNDAAKNDLDLDQSAVLDGGKKEVSRALPVNMNPSMKSSQKGDTVRLKSHEPEISNKHKCGNLSEASGVEMYNSSPQAEMSLGDLPNNFTSTSNDAAKNGLDLDQSAVLDRSKKKVSHALPVKKNTSMKSSQKGDTVRLKSHEPEISNKLKCGNPSEVQGVAVYTSSPQDEILLEDLQNDLTSTSTDAAKTVLDLDQSAVLDGSKKKVSCALPVNKNTSTSQKGSQKVKSPATVALRRPSRKVCYAESEDSDSDPSFDEVAREKEVRQGKRKQSEGKERRTVQHKFHQLDHQEYADSLSDLDHMDNDSTYDTTSSPGGSENDESSDIDEPPAPKKRRQPGSEEWKDGDLDQIELPCPEFAVPDNVQNPIEYFRYFFDTIILNHIVSETNKYSIQRDEVSMDVTKKEIEIFFGIWIYMGICKLPSYTDYWNEFTRVPQVANSMSLKRFEKIKARIHLADNEAAEENETPEEKDRLIKVRIFIDHMRRKCQGIAQKESKFSVDESMVPYRGRKAGSVRQYMPGKPHKWGFKFFNLCGVSGITYDFIPYMGANTFNKFCGVTLSNEEKGLGLGGQVVVSLAKKIHLPRLSVLCFDNFFTSIPLLEHLKQHFGLLSIGTIRSNRLMNCPLQTDKDLAKKGRGSWDVKVHSTSNVAVVKWTDNKAVTLASTLSGVQPEGVVQRWDKKEKTRVEVKCPAAILKYNSLMGGVDCFDMLVELYRTSSRSKRWYMPIIAYMMSMALVNSWLLYQQDCKLKNVAQEIKCSKDFRLHVYNSLVSTQKRRGRPAENEPKAKRKIRSPATPRPLDAERLDGLEHFPGYAETRGRCRYCKLGVTIMLCLKCNTRLCLTSDRNCFVHFHQVTNLESDEESDPTENPDEAVGGTPNAL